MSTLEAYLTDTRNAFDSVAGVYDGPAGNNQLIQRMRHVLWREIEAQVTPGARLLDLGCGTGLDAVHFGQLGYRVVAIDWSPRMVERTRARIQATGLADSVAALALGIHELDRLDSGQFDAIYSNLGPLNCTPHLATTARACARLLAPTGLLTASVLGRYCPWEILYYIVRRDWDRAWRRSGVGMVPVSLNGHTVWTRYFTPREFFRDFAERFEVVRYRALGLFLPPPYLIHLYGRHPRLFAPLAVLEDHLDGLPLLRNVGDHFLITLRKRRQAR